MPAIMTSMRPPRFLMHATFGAFDKAAALFLGAEPAHWLTMAGRKSRHLQSIPVGLHQVDGRSYLIDILPSKGWSSDLRIPGPGTLTTGRTDTDVTLTEVTDPAVKHQVVIAYAAGKPKILIAAVPRVAVFEVTPAQPHPAA
jgi:hypothetical protein